MRPGRLSTESVPPCRSTIAFTIDRPRPLPLDRPVSPSVLETFCGHGFHKDDPASQCYRGANTPLWFDPFTCIHPNTTGHHGR